ncbi:MAG: glucosaminidase domain-containing protein [Erysipelotrichaceae bacterium]|nr:glucosaminidase domain-containing protein [Erysipelotrichaceae bacterium]
MKKFFICLLTCLLCMSFLTPVKAATIKISATSATIKVSKTKTLSIKNTKKTITWSSTNKKIAKVSSKGKVTAVKPGTCTIKAKVKGQAKIYKCKVKVIAWLSASSATLEAKKTKTLTMHGTTIKSCSSSAKSIVTVTKTSSTKAKLTAVKSGSATIKIVGKDGKTYKCSVKVKTSGLAAAPTSGSSMTNKEFINKIAPIVVKYKKKYGYGVPSAIIAQACLESAYGTSKKAQYHNYFGLKYRANRVTCASGKFTDTNKEQNADGTFVTVSTDWYQFASMDAGVEGYFQFISISTYSTARKKTDPEAFLTALKAAGYASDLSYVSKNMAVVNKWNLTQYD